MQGSGRRACDSEFKTDVLGMGFMMWILDWGFHFEFPKAWDEIVTLVYGRYVNV